MSKRQIGFVAMATWLLLLVAFAQATSAQATSNAQTHNLSGGFWRVDGGFVSTLRIKNNLVVAPLQVMPTLYMADGTRYPLPPVNLAVGGVASISINDALLQAAASIPGHISGFGSVEVSYQYSSPGHVMAFVQALDVPRSLSLEWPLMEKMTPIPGVPDAMPASGPQTVEGLWWKRDAGVSGSVLLTNTTAEEQPVTVQLTGSKGKPIQPLSIQLAPHATHQFALDSLARAMGLLRHDAGGVRIQYNGEMGDVVVGGGLLNAEEGYSANMPFWWHDLSSQTAPMRFASAGLMVGKPDPALRFPAETTFSPYLALRNTTAVPLELTIELNYMQGSTPVSRTVPATLGAGEARQIDMTGLMAALGIKDLNGSINVGVSFSGRTGDLIIANGSVDQTGTYVFEVRPQAVTSAQRRIGDHWSIANGNDTMLSLWNPTAETEDVEVTFLYGDGSGRYVMEFHLAAGASAALDLKQLIAQGVPDKNGNLIPPGVEEGSVMLANPQGPTKPFTLAVALAVYNVANATCSGQCTNCCGPSGFTLNPGNFVMTVGEQMTCTCTETDCTGAQFSVNGTWSSSNTAVITVTSSGSATAVSAGTATISVDLGFISVGTGCIPNGCPQGHPVPNTGATVQVPTSLTVKSVSVLPTGTSGDYGCQPSTDFGIELDVQYQVLDQNGAALQNATMVPHEHVVVPATGQTTDNDVCPSRISTCAHTTDASGGFHDVPFGGCSNGSFSVAFTQSITILLNGLSYPVRTNNTTVSSSSSGHGSITNGSDTNKTR